MLYVYLNLLSMTGACVPLVDVYSPSWKNFGSSGRSPNTVATSPLTQAFFSACLALQPAAH